MPQAAAYHHGDLAAACLQAARELLEEDGSAALSLRAVARRAGVSATAPYRHYPDRESLVSAVAAQGYRELAEDLAGAHPSPTTPEDLIAIAVAYVRFALDHPALFRAMFAEPCDPSSADRVSATAAITEYVRGIVHAVFPGADAAALSTTVWALVHGLAFLHLDGKLDSSTPEAVAAQVRAAVESLFTVASALPAATRSA
ncbi:TetR-family transcriptional regulator [Streptomyces albus]|uniref:TetR-family transcriptional regulator n=1 Tax=Streptomyces albus (strain ATCC 21838 / DSM 41398 / FERM P-419 / JCM 4703 / NBRC 107858) TaxID=1081613 RepID=A0A0B5EG21_STRA4|nr:TetR-family transcriptional regulator [Streptomyces albus]AOU75290.1 TetR-family transcriptional regulator [Streptomyces albus]AYN31095.1 TetR family transcriptional regulator [Streptomyces albus]